MNHDTLLSDRIESILFILYKKNCFYLFYPTKPKHSDVVLFIVKAASISNKTLKPFLVGGVTVFCLCTAVLLLHLSKENPHTYKEYVLLCLNLKKLCNLALTCVPHRMQFLNSNRLR